MQESKIKIIDNDEPNSTKKAKLYDLTINWQTENTNQLSSQSTNFLVNYGFTHSPFGKALVMGTKQGICGITFTNQLGDEETLRDMMQRWPIDIYS